MTSSTLVETVSIDYEDFTEGFLTCSTCLCTYDSSEHSPKLLSCSHTLCKGCLEKMTSQPGVTDSFRCPICRECVPLPMGGVASLPASFVVNQLLDLVSKQRREVVPKCSVHLHQQLLFCEPCDCVFCALCTKDAHQSKHNQQHTVIPFSIAIKRMSEILLYKAQQCVAKLGEAQDCITSEMARLDANAEATCKQLEDNFARLRLLVEERQQQLLEFTKRTADAKRAVLRKQLETLNSQRSEVESQCSGLPQYQLDVRNLSRKIAELSTKLDSLADAQEPQENCFIQAEPLDETVVEDMRSTLSSVGQVRTSRTCPALCQISVNRCAAHLRATATLVAYDYAGERQTFGGDPLSAQLVHLPTEREVDITIQDLRDGTYELHFVPEMAGEYALSVRIFGRQVAQFPLRFEAAAHINPLCIYGTTGTDAHQFRRPVGLAVANTSGQLFVLDTGNCRVKVLCPNTCSNSPFKLLRHLSAPVLENGACTGLAWRSYADEERLILSNWSSHTVVELDAQSGALRRTISSALLQEPTCVAVSKNGNEIIVVDNGAGAAFVFDVDGKVRLRIPTSDTDKSSFTTVGAVAVDDEDNVILADKRISVYCGRTGRLLRLFEADQKQPTGTYGGLAYDGRGHLLATRMCKSRNCIQVFDYLTGKLKHNIDSSDARLKRPSCLATTDDYHVVVVDLGNDCIKKYRYF